MTLCVTSQWELVTWQCSSYAGLSDPYPALVLYLAGDALHHQPMGGWSHDCSSYVGCGDFRVLHWCHPVPACISGNKLWHPDDYLIWRPRTGFRPAQCNRRYVGLGKTGVLCKCYVIITMDCGSTSMISDTKCNSDCCCAILSNHDPLI